MFQEYLEKIKKTLGVIVLYAVLYARYSSDMQRSESIDAQIRAIELFAKQHGIIIIKKYIDEAQSAKFDDREAFQQMIADASHQSGWQILLVHKLDRFARNRYDSANYRVQLRKHNKYLISVTEQLDDSPESVMLEAVIEGMAEYYSKNLSREVMKGMKENAMKGITCGGTAPLGYNIDPVTKKYVVNPFEAQAVQLIFTRFIDGVGYTEIIRELNASGFRTKKNRTFVKNSITDILRNEKYTGVYVYNRREKANEVTGARNNHSLKSNEEIIRVPNAFPAIISKEQFERVQNIFSARKRRYTHNTKERYLLTGKCICSICGASYVGKRIKKKESVHVYYGCSCKERAAGLRCINTYVQRDFLEGTVIQAICDYVMHFDDSMVDEIYNQYLGNVGDSHAPEIEALRKELLKIENNLNRIVDVISVTNMQSLVDKLNSLEQQKKSITDRIKILSEAQYSPLSQIEIIMLFDEAKQMLREKSLPRLKQLIDLVVNKIIVSKDEVVVYFNYSNKKIKQKIYA